MEIITKLRKLNIELTLVEGKLKVNAPEGVVTKEILGEIKSCKEDLVSYISRVSGKINYVAIPRARESAYYPLSKAQQRLYFVHELDKSSLAYNMPKVMKLIGHLDVERLKDALSELINRHESLRTSFSVHDDEPVQVIHTDFSFELKQYKAEEDQADGLINAFIRPFDLTKAPLFRAGVVELCPETHLLMIDMHHIIADGISQGILIKDFMALYSGRELAPLSLQYKDYATWKSDSTQDLEEHRSYWFREFAEETERLELPVDFKRPAIRKFSGAKWRFEIGEEETAGLKALADVENTTMFMVVFAAFNVLLSKLGNLENTVVGIPVSGREHVDLENVIGMFVNTLPLRNQQLGQSSFASYLQEVKRKTLAGIDHQAYSYDALIDELKLGRNTSRNPLFDVMFIYENYEHDMLQMPDLRLEPYNTPHEIAKFDLSLEAKEADSRLFMSFEYSTELFKEETVIRFSKYLQKIIAIVSTDANIKLADIDLLNEQERNQLLYTFNSSDVNFPKQETVISLFEKQVATHPDKVAVSFEGKTITYKALDERAGSLAHWICQKSEGRQKRIGLLFQNSIDMVAAILAVLKSGNIYVPLSPDAPIQRNVYILEDAAINVLIIDENLQSYSTDLKYKGAVIEVGQGFKATPQNFENVPVAPEDLINIIYTSGTTGQPRGVEVQHAGLVNYTFWKLADFNYSPKDVTLQLTPYYFDAFASGFYPSLLSGGTLILIPESKKFDAKYIVQVIRKHRVTNFSMTPAFYEALLDELTDGEKADYIRFVVLGGEKASNIILEKSRTFLSHTTLYNEYGPTETSVAATCNINLKTENASVIGKPIANATAYILDHSNRVLPVGVPGELCVGGAGVARGYLNNDDLTNNKFIANPYKPDERIYKTGDCARWLSDGTIEYLGRFDNQVKVRGFRIELGEIEGILSNFVDISDTVVIAKGEGTDKYLVAYYVSDAPIAGNTLRQYMHTYLPEYMVPSYFVHLENLPLTPNGKVNRKELPEPDVIDGEEYIAPVSKTEQMLTSVWGKVLKLDSAKISTDKSFFELGGNSLKATVLVNRIHKEFKIEFPLREVFEKQDIQSQSAFIDDNIQNSYQSIAKAPVHEFYPLSSAQSRLYFFYELDPGSLVYNTPKVLRLSGEVNKERIEHAFKALIGRHESLRTSFEIVKGKPVQRVSDQVDFQLEYHIDSNCNADAVIKNFVRPFVLSKAPLLRVGLVKMESDYLFIVDIHHIVADGVSVGVLIKDFMALYNNEVLPELQLQYKDFAFWQHQEDQLIRIEEDKTFWVNEFLEEPDILELPADFPRPRVKSYQGDQVHFTIEQEVAEKLHLLAHEEGVTIFMVLLSAYNILLSRLTNQDDIVVGIPVAGRQHADLEEVIGMFVNTLAVRNFPKAELSFRQLLQAVKDKLISCFEHQAYPYESLLEEIRVDRNTSRNPLFDTMFVFENYETEKLQMSGVDMHPFQARHNVSKFDLTLEIAEVNGQFSMAFEYSSELFKKETIERFVSYFKKILSQVVKQADRQISAINILSENEELQLLRLFNDTRVEYDEDVTVVTLFEKQAMLFPDTIAVLSGKDSITYSELNNRANFIAREITSKLRSATGQKIGVLFEPGSDMLASFIGILKAGGAYVPLSHDSPEERNSYILKNCNAELIIVDASLLQVQENLPAYLEEVNTIVLQQGKPQEEIIPNPVPVASQEDSIYVIYTSGTTGQPKGVDVKHGGIANMLSFFNDAFKVNNGTKMSQVAKITFDASAFEIWPCLAHGGTLHLAPALTTVDPGLMKKWLISNEIEITYQSTAIAEYLLQKDWSEDEAQLRVMNIAGDRLNRYHSLSMPFHVYNLYGPTEDSVWTTWKEITAESKPDHYSIGRPIANKQVYVLSKDGHLQPVGVRGELCISGKGLARGYVNNKEITVSKFIDNPFIAGQKLYKTGDLARWLQNGEIEFLGRIDSQVKIRGYRIELGEIENLMVRHQQIREATVVAIGEGGEKYLVAYYASAEKLDISALRKYLATTLPEYMIPAYFVHLTKLPLTPHGKIDKRALPKPEIKTGTDYIGATNEVEEKLVEIWSEILKIDSEKIGIHSNFFELGGHSINIINLSHEINEKFKCEISVANMFSLPTIAMIADFIIKGDKAAEDMVGHIEESMIEAESNINLLSQLDD